MQALEDLPFVGGNVALDFVNTAEERGHPEAGDVLRSAEDLRRWGQRYGLLSGGSGGESVAGAARAEAAELARALEARELLYELFLARVQGRPAAPADLDRLAQLVADAHRAGALTPTAEGTVAWSWPETELATVRHVAVNAAVELLAGDRLARLRQCPGDQCGWFFLDATKRGNRRWCSMSECGQEAKTARRRVRRADPAGRGSARDDPAPRGSARDDPTRGERTRGHPTHSG